MDITQDLTKDSPLHDTSPSLITFDMDWAPDWSIEAAATLCLDLGIPATFYVTHETPMLSALAAEPSFELGIHPNFLEGSDHGAEPRAILDHVIDLVPDAATMRTHSLMQWTGLFATVGDHYPQILSDLSLHLPLADRLHATKSYFGERRRLLWRLPYFWEDDVMAEWPGWRWDGPVPQPDGLAIFNFHPVLMSLNLQRMAPYQALKHSLANKRFPKATREDFAPFVAQGDGAGGYLERIVEARGAETFTTVSAYCTTLLEPSATAVPCVSA